MAVTRISDVIVPAVFNPYVIQRTAQLSALFRSSIIQPDQRIQELAQGPAAQFNMPFWNDLTGSSNVGSDDPAVNSVPQKIGANKDIAQKHFRNQSWSSADLVSRLNGSDPMGAIGELVAEYWAREMQTIAIAALTGVFASNSASNGGDMVVSVATDAVGAPAAGEKISGSLILTAKQTMGDAAAKLTAIAMHSMLHTELQRQGLIAFIPNDTANIGWGTYMGYSVLVDDGCPAVMGTNRITYTSYLFGPGALGYGEGTPRVPTATVRLESGGNGEGIEEMYQRKHFVLHPRGVKFNGANMAGVSPTNAELALAANWSRVYERKNVRLVALRTNG